MAGLPIRLVIIDSHAFARRDMKAALNPYGDVRVIGDAGDGQSGLELVQRLKPDTILLDLNLPDMDGVEFIQAALSQQPHEPCIILLNTNRRDKRLIPAFTAGARGSLPADPKPEELIEAIRAEC